MCNLTHISEVFIEAVVQLHLYFLLIGWLAAIDSFENSYFQKPHTSAYERGNFVDQLGENKWLIWLSFSISVSSATFGLAKFLKSGPFKILNEGSHTAGIGITLLIISSFMISKAVWIVLNDRDSSAAYNFAKQNLPFIGMVHEGLGQLNLTATWYIFWLIFSMVPQILMVSFLFKIHNNTFNDSIYLGSDHFLLSNWFQEDTFNAFNLARNVAHCCVHAFYIILHNIEQEEILVHFQKVDSDKFRIVHCILPMWELLFEFVLPFYY